MKSLLKHSFRSIASILVAPALCIHYVLCQVGDRNACFAGASQVLSLLPGVTGSYIRAAFYRYAMQDSSQDVYIGFGTLFSQTNTRIGAGVYIGPQCNIGSSNIGDDCLIGSGVHILSGKNQHTLDRLDVPVRDQGGVFTTITVGEDTWVGNGAIIMADVGKQCVIAAGSVVTRPVNDFEIVSGNPASVVRKRV